MIRGHTLVQNIRRGHYQFGHDHPIDPTARFEAAFDELRLTLQH